MMDERAGFDLGEAQVREPGCELAVHLGDGLGAREHLIARELVAGAGEGGKRSVEVAAPLCLDVLPDRRFARLLYIGRYGTRETLDQPAAYVQLLGLIDHPPIALDDKRLLSCMRAGARSHASAFA
jgi:hypothetical protein